MKLDHKPDCFHCGDLCDQPLQLEEKFFCCQGCKTVYALFQENDLGYYYELEQTPGIKTESEARKFDFLENSDIADKLLEFDEGGTQIIQFTLPGIHCSSCIWVLENLQKLHEGVIHAQVNFPKKSIRITFNSDELTLKELAVLLTRIGYEPKISLDDFEKGEKSNSYSLLYKLGVAGFAFGNIMFLSFPEYFEVGEFWLEQYKHTFRWLIFAFSLPVVFYAASGYFSSAWKGLKSKVLNIDVPIALGVAVLFIRSSFEIFTDTGTGFFDSLAGLVFFLLLGRFFQQKTYAHLSFDRDYKSYFPIAVTRLRASGKQEDSEEQVQVYELQRGDRILVRNNEIIPADGILISPEATLNYSFVTGEAEPVLKTTGDQIFAGGRQQGTPVMLEVTKPVTQSYLTQLWSHDAFAKAKKGKFDVITDRVGRKFTVAIIAIACIAAISWSFIEPSLVWNVFTAVLIVACPCAIALAAPFTLGNMLRIYGNRHLYLKDATIVEKMAEIDTVVFDKTGTLTESVNAVSHYEGMELSVAESALLSTTLRGSNHPLSRSLYNWLQKQDIVTLDDFDEIPGKGLSASGAGHTIRIGKQDFAGNGTSQATMQDTRVHISTEAGYKGCYYFKNKYRQGIEQVIKELKPYRLAVLSGDHDGERKHLESIMPADTQMLFDQKPQDKLEYIRKLQEDGRKVMMIGDGLNDAGALAISDVGISITENLNIFSPACDGILDARALNALSGFLSLSRKSLRIIKWAFGFSLLYNLIGLGFAVTGMLEPVVAAILMPLSSISIVGFSTLLAWYEGKKMQITKNNPPTD